MGWERKRGKIEEFNRLLRGATDTSFVVQVGNLAVQPPVQYCITLDSDTRLPRDAARLLIGVITHPLNRPTFDPKAGRVTDGYGILQPRVSVTFASAGGSLFARVYSGHTGVDPYTTAVSDTYQDLFSEGIFTGDYGRVLELAARLVVSDQERPAVECDHQARYRRGMVLVGAGRRCAARMRSMKSRICIAPSSNT